MKHTQGEWRVQADPEFVGGHPYHQNRYITYGPGNLADDDWDFNRDSGIICVMRDTVCQAADAKLIAASPKLLAALKRALPWLGRMIADGGHRNCVAPNDAIGAMQQAEAAIDLTIVPPTKPINPYEDWKREVANDETRVGYDEWLEYTIKSGK